QLIYYEEYLWAFKESLKTLRRMVQARTPRGSSLRLYHSISYSMVDLTPRDSFGFLAGSPRFEGKVYARKEMEVTWGIFSTPYTRMAPHADAVEYGTKPHFPPIFGPESIHGWAGHVLPMMDKFELAQVAYRIALHISKHGTRPRYMFRDARQQFQASRILERNFNAASVRARSRVPAIEELP
ncbi:unnamed protein product, partial [marine sediment metagenome]